MARKTKTPKSISIIRKIMIYLGASTFLPAFFKKLGINDIEFSLQAWMIAIGIIQIIADKFFIKEKDSDTYTT